MLAFTQFYDGDDIGVNMSLQYGGGGVHLNLLLWSG